MSNIFFTADTHFGHKKILEYVKRPFPTVEEMDEAIIKNWNAVVGPDDHVYHLGDVALCSAGRLREVLGRLNGKIYLIRGNHEKSAEACHDRFEWIKDYYELEVEDPDGFQGKQLVVLFHYAMRVWNACHYGTYHLYGHSHGELPDDPHSRSIDIGVDVHGFSPVSYGQVKEIMGRKQWQPPALRSL